MPTARPPRSAVTRAASTAVLLLALTGCSLTGGQPGSAAGQPGSAAGQAGPEPGTSSPSSAEASAPTVEQACARVLETVRTAPQQLQEDPAGLFAEVDELAATAPDELSGQLTSAREAVAAFRQGERSFISVVQEIRGLQQRCSR